MKNKEQLYDRNVWVHERNEWMHDRNVYNSHVETS